MEKAIAKQLILEYQQITSNVDLVEREVSLSDSVNYVLVGLRRSGKSYLLYQQIKNLIAIGHSHEEILYFNFEDDRLDEISLKDLDMIKTCYEELFPHRPIFFLDEIQNVEGWEHFARRLADQKYRVYITGSNAKMLSTEIAGTLGGRYMVQNVYPYSFREYLSANKIYLADHWELSPKKNEVVRNFDTYLRFGGLPELCQIPVKLRRAWLNNLYNKIFFGDILMRYSVRNTLALKVLVRKLAESVKQPCSYTRLANIVSSTGKKTRTETIIDYLDYAQESCIVFALENYAAKIAEKVSNKKYYFTDNGILNLFLFDPETSLLENLVAIRLHTLYDDVFFYHDGIEVDFYLWEHRTAIQVCWSIGDEETRMRETNALIKLSSRLPVERMMIVTNDESGIIEIDDKRISVVPAWRWMTEESEVRN